MSGVGVTVQFEKTNSPGLQMTSTLTGTSDIFNDTSRLPELYFVNGQTNCSSLPSEYDAGLLTNYTKSPAVETKTIETLTFSMLDTSCLIVVRKKAPSGRLIDDRITIVKLNSASFEIVGNGGEPAIETPTTTTTTTTTTPIPEPCCAGNACEQLKEVLKIKDPYADSDTLVAAVPSPNPVSNTVGETDGFGILYPLAIGVHSGPISVNTSGHTTNLPGLRFLFAPGGNIENPEDLSHQINPTQTMAQAIGGNFWTSGTNCQNCRLETMALSIVDFNNFRAKVEDAINILDGKIRQILAVQEPTCP